MNKKGKERAKKGYDYSINKGMNNCLEYNTGVYSGVWAMDHSACQSEIK